MLSRMTSYKTQYAQTENVNQLKELNSAKCKTDCLVELRNHLDKMVKAQSTTDKQELVGLRKDHIFDNAFVPVQIINTCRQDDKNSVQLYVQPNSPVIETGNAGLKMSQITFSLPCKENEVKISQQNILSTQNSSNEQDRLICSVCGLQCHDRSHWNVHSLIHKGERPHVCSLCGQSFTRKFDMTRHELLHKKPRKHMCLLCTNVSFSNASQLDRHIQLLHKNSNESKLKIDRSVADSSRTIEIGETVAQCFANENSISMRHTDTVERKMKLEKYKNNGNIGGGFDIVKGVKNSLSKRVAENLIEQENQSETQNISYQPPFIYDKNSVSIFNMASNDDQLSDKANEPTKTTFRNLPFISPNQSSDINSSIPGFTVSESEPMGPQLDSLKVKIMNTEAQQFCTVNQKYRLAGLNTAAQKIDKNNLLRCNVCDLRCYNRGSLKVHSMIHTGEKPYICEICNRGFIRKYDMTRHMLVVHRKKNVYKCNLCNAYFKNQNKFDRHVLKHEQHGYSITTIKEINYPQSEVRPTLSCPDLIVDEVGAQGNNISSQGHTPTSVQSLSPPEQNKTRILKCSVCGQRCASRSQLMTHVMIHTGEKPYSCEICGKRFVRKYDMNTHVLTHRKEGPYECNMCTVYFKSKLALENHMLRHTEEDNTNSDEEEANIDGHIINDIYENENAKTVIPYLEESRERKVTNLREENTEVCVNEDDLIIPNADLGDCANETGQNEVFKPISDPSTMNKPSVQTDKILNYCDTCNKGFYRLSDLKRHIMAHDNTKRLHGSQKESVRLHQREKKHIPNFTCGKCFKNFRNQQSLQKHKAYPCTARPFACSDCPRRYIWKHNLLEHQRLHRADNPYTCDQCGIRFTRHSHLLDHLAIHTGKPRHVCVICKERFVTSRGLDQHIKVHHTNIIFCKTCGEQFDSNKRLEVHNNQAHGVPVESFEELQPINKVGHRYNWTPRKPKKMYQCHICHKFLNRIGALSRHLLKHTSARPYACSVCNKHFKSKGEVEIHMVVHREKEFACEICGQRYSRVSSLNIHMLSHIGHRSFTCETCGKSFIYAANLSAHRQIHDGVRELLCDLCNKRFRQKSHFITHMKQHLGMRTYLCGICGKQFYSNSNLNGHVRTHSDDRQCECKECGKCFRTDRDLRKHLFCHSGQTPFCCDVCPQKFKNRANLKNHMLIHAGLKPHKCPQCDRTFRQRGSVGVHMRKVHGDK